MSEATEEGVQVINQWFHDRDRNLPAAQILKRSREQFIRIREAIEVIPSEELETRFAWLDGHPLSAVIEGTLEHLTIDHEPEIRAWLNR